jgi:hypothetical protein
VKFVYLEGDVTLREGPVPLLIQAVIPVPMQDHIHEFHPAKLKDDKYLRKSEGTGLHIPYGRHECF